MKFTPPSSRVARPTVYEITGQGERELMADMLPTGGHAVMWDGSEGSGRPASSDVYIVWLDAGGKTSSVKMTLLR